MLQRKERAMLPSARPCFTAARTAHAVECGPLAVQRCSAGAPLCTAMQRGRAAVYSDAARTARWAAVLCATLVRSGASRASRRAAVQREPLAGSDAARAARCAAVQIALIVARAARAARHNASARPAARASHTAWYSGARSTARNPRSRTAHLRTRAAGAGMQRAPLSVQWCGARLSLSSAAPRATRHRSRCSDATRIALGAQGQRLPLAAVKHTLLAVQRCSVHRSHSSGAGLRAGQGVPLVVQKFEFQNTRGYLHLGQ